MSNLFIILVVLFVALGIIVTLAEKYAKPLTEEQQHNYSRILMVMMGLVVIGSIVSFFFRN